MSRVMRGRAAMRPGVVLGLLGGTCVLLAVLLVFVPRRAPTSAQTASVPPTTDTPDVAASETPPESAAPPPASTPEQVIDPPAATVTGTAVSPDAPAREPAATVDRVSPGAVAVVARPPRVAGKLCIVIDDAGYSLSALDAFLKLRGEITIAVIPGLANSAEAARRVRAAGKTLFLHAPMQPEGGQDPGPDALRTDMDDHGIRTVLGRWLGEVGPVAGINNHMGSLATAHEATMRSVLAVARERSLVFLDSRTTARTVSAAVGGRLGVPVAERDVFLDDEPGVEPVTDGMERAKTIARRRGYALAIGHVQNSVLAAYLERSLPALEKEGYVLVSPAQIAREREKTR